MVGIYKITNPAGLVYIGKSRHIKSRFSCYRSLNCKGQPLLYNSLLIYGYIRHKFEVISECLIDELTNLERFYILFYCSDIVGLNSKHGDIIYRTDEQISTDNDLKLQKIHLKRLAINKRKKYDIKFRIKLKNKKLTRIVRYTKYL